MPRPLKIRLTPDAVVQIQRDYIEACEENDGVAMSTADRYVFEAMIDAKLMPRDPRDANA